MQTLICGSVAYDTIMVFKDRFKNHILPEQLHTLNIAFLVPEMKREFGGCAGNIAYNLKMLGEDPLIMAAVGMDFAPYKSRLEHLGLSTDYILSLQNTFTAQAFITTDSDDNQITSFHPGAMNLSHQNSVSSIKERVDLGIVSPDGKEGMVNHAQEFSDSNTPFIFDPGQGLPMFEKEELLRFLDQADYLAVNEYEAKLIEEKTGMSTNELANMVKAYFITRGEKGSTVITGKETIAIPAVPPVRVKDPTGCGDAYRAALLFGIPREMSWESIGRLGSLLGSLKISVTGPQNHDFCLQQVREKFEHTFGDPFLF